MMVDKIGGTVMPCDELSNPFVCAHHDRGATVTVGGLLIAAGARQTSVCCGDECVAAT
jgi:hypothetical protein